MIVKYFHQRGIQLPWDPRGAFSGPALQFSCIIIFNFSTPTAYLFWIFSHVDDKVMTDLFFHEGTGHVCYMRVPGQRRALRVSPAETWLMVYRRRRVWGSKISPPDVTFRFYFCDFFKVASLFWL